MQKNPVQFIDINTSVSNIRKIRLIRYQITLFDKYE